MNIYLISQTINNGYDTYDSAVVVAENEDDARTIHPNGNMKVEIWGEYNTSFLSWVTSHEMDHIKVQLIGKAFPTVGKGVVLASFNAG